MEADGRSGGKTVRDRTKTARDVAERFPPKAPLTFGSTWREAENFGLAADRKTECSEDEKTQRRLATYVACAHVLVHSNQCADEPVQQQGQQQR